MGMWACARFLRVAAYASKSHRPFQHRLMSHSPPSLQMHDTNVPSHISNFKKRYSTFRDPPFCFSLQLTQCTSMGRLGTSCLVQRRTKTRPTSASTTPPRVKKPLHIFSVLRRLSHVSSFNISILHHHLLLVFLLLLAVDLFNRTLPSSPKTSVKVIDYIPICIFKITSWKP